MRILVTGGCGFIGSNLINFLLTKNFEVINFDNLSLYKNNKSLVLNKIVNNKKYKFVLGDLVNYKDISFCLKHYEPNIIFNLAAESHVDNSIDNPTKSIKTNINGSYNLLESIRTLNSLKLKKIIHISTDEVYGSSKRKSCDEENRLNPSSPYSSSKASAELLAFSYFQTYNLPVIVANPSNNYGPFQFPEKLIPLTISKCLKKEKIGIYGNGKNLRDWMYVDDTIKALYLIMKKGKFGDKYNISTQKMYSNNYVVQFITNEFNKKSSFNYNKLIEYVKDRPSHDFSYKINSKKIRYELGWKNQTSFDNGIIKTIKWFIKNEKNLTNIRNKIYDGSRLGNIKTKK